MRKRFIIIIVALVVVVGVIVYFFITGAPSSTTPGGQTGSLPGASVGTGGALLPGVGTSTPLGSAGSQIAIVDSGPVAAYFANSTGTVTVVRSNGAIVQIANGQAVSLSSSSISDIISAAFSYDGRKIAISYGSAANPQTSVFDAQSRTWTQLSMGMLSPVWSPLDYRLAFLRNGGNGTESLNVIDFSKAKPTASTLGTWYVQDMALQWTMSSTIILSGSPSARADVSALAFNTVKSTLTPIVVSRAGFSAIWNGTPSMGLAFSTTPAQRGGHLQLIDVQGATLQNLSFLTLPLKCAFGQAIGPAPSSAVPVVPSSTKAATSATSSLRTTATSTLSFYLALYCAVPNDQDTLSYKPLPDAYLQHAIPTNDTVYRINITTGHIDTAFSGLASGLDATMLHAAGTKLYFVNWYDKKLYSVVLP